MRKITYRTALNEALYEEMTRDATVFLIGQDIGTYGGAFRVTDGLLAKFGTKRVIETPISEAAIAGAAVGAAIMGTKPVAEIMFQDFSTLAMDQIFNCGAKMRYLHAGLVKVPMVIRMPFGAMVGGGAHHCQSIEAMFCHMPGIIVVVPSTPYDAKGLLKLSIRDPNPIIFLEHKLLYGVQGDVPKEEYTVPLRKAEIKRQGKHVTVVTWGLMVNKALAAAVELAEKGVELEVLDLRTLYPFDKEAIINSVKKTGKLIIAHEACKTGGFGGEIAAIVSKEAFGYLDAPIERIAALDTPVPFSPPLLEFFLPNEKNIIDVAQAMV